MLSRQEEEHAFKHDCRLIQGFKEWAIRKHLGAIRSMKVILESFIARFGVQLHCMTCSSSLLDIRCPGPGPSPNKIISVNQGAISFLSSDPGFPRGDVCWS